MAEADLIADELCGVLAAAAHEHYIGEPVSQLAHALQAAQLAVDAGAEDELVLAALLHDIGHLAPPPGSPSMDGLGVVQHERHGAALLQRHGFSDRVCALVAGHVDAKRYLASIRPEYLARLSDASRGTLAWQGGPMSDAEASRFRGDPLFEDKLRLRVWDEGAKDPGAVVSGLGVYRARLVVHLSMRQRDASPNDLTPSPPPFARLGTGTVRPS